GEFTIAQIEYAGFPQRMVITATSANMNASLKSVKSRSFIDKTLKDIIDQIAQENNYIATVGDDIADKKYTHLDQVKESDINFLTRIAKEIDCVCKFMQNRILFIKNSTSQTATGKALR
ncbi:contractile injection system protein, VgrG/Pvc8 family, partial [Piscirickettsia salmonis]|uniref:contractile injection system protein, VgrG/Pvc8 family n=1 Tax=Piscirickettsia salmonis TaxID=1238 RepID=UPI003EBAA7A8